MNAHYDIAVVGGGPAGCAAAITAAQAGLAVCLLERCPLPRHAVGETLHPGVEPLLVQLGVLGQVQAAGFIRHHGHWVCRENSSEFVPFAPAGQSWFGFQVWRPTFDALLLEGARKAGVFVMQPVVVRGTLADGDTVTGVVTDRGPIFARFVIDATGRSKFLTKQLDLAVHCDSPCLVARYGYQSGAAPGYDVAPVLSIDTSGWNWIARVRPGVYQWTALHWDRPLSKRWLPAPLKGLATARPSRGADVSWRIARRAAGPGYFLVGDAASQLDPSSSHGILKAIMTGMMAAHLIARNQPPEDANLLAAHYASWLKSWHDDDARRLRDIFSHLGRSPEWLGNPTPAIGKA